MKNINNLPEELRNITQILFQNCQQKEIKFADQFGVSVVEFRCLNIIYQAEKLNVNQIAEKLNVTSGRITRLTDQLLEKDLIHRNPGVEDRRQNVIFLTEEGITLIEKMNKEYFILQQDVLDGIPEDEQELMIKMLGSLNMAVANVLEKL